MTAIAYRILKFESMIKKPIMENSLMLLLLARSMPSLVLSNTTFISSNLQKDFHQENLSFVCLQFYKHKYL